MTDETSASSAVSAGPEPPAGPAPASLAPPAGPAPASLAPPGATLQRWEIVAVLAVSLGASGLYALVSFIGSLTARQSLSQQTATLNGTLATARPRLDLFLELTIKTVARWPVLLVFSALGRE